MPNLPSTARNVAETPHDASFRWLDAAVDRIVQAIDPQELILFGSFARGTQTRKSDIDLFVIWDTDLKPLDRIGVVLNLLRDAPRPIEPVVYTPAEVEQNQALPFVRRILTEGRVLYRKLESEPGKRESEP